MPVGYLVSGDLSREPNLQALMEARAQVGSNFLAGIATDETDPDRAIDQLCSKLEYALREHYLPPQNFYGIGGMKIFRDLIWQMQGMMKADHKFYKKHKQYDFPQKNPGDQHPGVSLPGRLSGMLRLRRLREVHLHRRL